MKKVYSQGNIPSGASLDPMVTYTGFNNTKDSRGMRHSKLLSEFRIILTKHLAGPKDGTAFAPATFDGGRKKEDVRQRTMVVFDIEKQHNAPRGISDKGTLVDSCPPPLSTIEEKAKALGIACIGYTTFTHDPNEPRYRIILPLEQHTKAGDPEDNTAHARLIRKDALAVRAVATLFGLEPYLDVGKTIANSIFFYPRAAKENLQLAESFSTDGKLLNFEPYLDAADQQVAREVSAAEKEAVLKAQAIFKNISDDNASSTDGDLMARLRHSIGPMEVVLRKYGYKEYPEAQRWAPPNSDTLAPGILLYKGTDGVTRLYSHHANDPLCGEKEVFGSRAHDVIDVVIANEYGTSDECRTLGISELMKKYGITFTKGRKSGATKAQNVSEIKPQEWSEVVNFIEHQYIPQFPMDALNSSEKEYVQQTARSIGVETGPIAMTMLANASATLDARTKLRPKKLTSWEESKCLWLCLIGPSAAKKSPILNRVKKPIQKIQDIENRRYKAAKAKFDLLPKDQKAKQAEPNCKHYMVQDTTIEALSRALSHQDRGTTLLVDELETVFQSMTRYKKTGTDRAHYLGAYQGGSVNIMRVGGGYTIVDNFAFGLIGGIQPDVIAKYRDLEDGLLERFIFVRLSEAVIGEDIDTSEVENEFEAKINSIKSRNPEVLSFDADARECVSRIEKAALSLSSNSRIVGPGFGGWSGVNGGHKLYQMAA